MRINIITIIITCGLILFFSSCMTFPNSSIGLGSNYIFRKYGRDQSIYLQPDQTLQIYSLVTDYKFDNNYIIAKQNPDYNYYKFVMTEHYWGRYAVYSEFLKDSISNDYGSPAIKQSIREYRSDYLFLKSKGVTNNNGTIYIIKKVIDSIFTTDPFYIKLFSSKENYWIIDKQMDIRYGPLSKQEFDSECEKKSIELKFD